MAKQENESHEGEEGRQTTPINILFSFETFGAQFQKIKERENPNLLSVKGSINDEYELPNGRKAAITWKRESRVHSPESKSVSGWIALTGGDLPKEGIRRLGYEFGWEANTKTLIPYIIKFTLRDGETVVKGDKINLEDGKELRQVSVLIKELSNKVKTAMVKKPTFQEPKKRI